MEKRKGRRRLLLGYQNVQDEELKKEHSDYLGEKKGTGERIPMIFKKFGKMKLSHY